MYRLFKLIVWTLSLSSAVSLYSFSLTSSESYVKEMNALSNFKKLYISAGPMEIILNQGNKQEVRLEGEKDLIDQLDVKVVQGELDILYKDSGKKTGTPVEKSGTVKVYITTKYLSSITARGVVDITSKGPWKVNSLSFLLTGSGTVKMLVHANALTVHLSGSSELELNGTANNQSIAITGSGKYNADSLKSDTAQVVVSGAGSAEVFVRKSLNVTIYGSGDVHYKSTPAIESNIYGSGRVIKSSSI